MSNVSFKAALGGSIGESHGGEGVVNDLTDIIVVYQKTADDGMASTTTADTYLGTAFTFPVQVIAVKYVANNTITANDTNYATLQIKKDDGVGGSAVVAAALSTTTTDSGNVVAGVAKNFTLTPANLVIPAGANMIFAIAKVSSGVVVRTGAITVRLRRLG